MSEGRRVAANTLFNTIGGVSVQLLTIVTGIFVARHFGAESFGQLTLAATIIGYFTLVTEFGLSTIAIRVVARTGEPERYIWSYLVIRLALAGLALAILAGVIAVAQFSRSTAWLIVAYALTIPAQIFKVNWLFYARQNMYTDNILQVSEKLLYTLCLFSLIFLIKDIILVPIALLISILFVAALSWFLFLRSKNRPIAWTLDKLFIKEIVSNGWPVGVAGAALQTNSNVDTIFVNAYHGNLQTGFYGAAYRLINAMITAGTFFTNAIYPLSCRRYHESKSSLSSFISYSSKLLMLITVPGVILLSICSVEIITLVFGKAYANSAFPFKILVWAAGIAIVCRLYHNTLVACERQHSFMKIILASAGVNLILNFLLIPRFGMMGAASATVITELFLLIMTYIALYRVLKMKLLANSAAVVITAGFASIAFFLPVPLLTRVAIFIVVYVLFSYWLRLWGGREWKMVRAILSKG